MPKLKNYPNFSGLLPVSLWIGPKSEYGKLLCLMYRFISHTQIWDVSTRKKVSRYGVIYYRVLCQPVKIIMQRIARSTLSHGTRFNPRAIAQMINTIIKRLENISVTLTKPLYFYTNRLLQTYLNMSSLI